MSHLAYKTYREASAYRRRDSLVLENLGLVKQILGRIKPRLPQSVDFESLESAGVLGLVEASHQFDEDQGVSFRTFAYRRVRGAIFDELRRNCPLPQDLMGQVSRVRGAMERLSPPVTTERIANACDLSVHQVEVCLAGIRLSNPVSFTEHNVRASDVHEVSLPLEIEEAKQMLADCIEQLPDKQRHVLTLYHLEKMQMKEISHVMNLSVSSVSRILAKAEQLIWEMLDR